MRIVQTFWSAGRNPLEHSFGWLRPEYNLMSWALSLLCLRKHYNEVALYTDEQGRHVLIDLLHLPYTEVNVVYDETLCLPQHWAYAKIKTYSLQTKPFLHVDGDVFLPAPIPEDIMNAPLIAQNREIGTAYYKRMMDRILQEPAIKLPKYVEDGLKEESIASYNMGLFGGNDMNFIHAYSEEALALCDKNKAICLNGNFNLLFEQMFFAFKARKEGLSVSTIFPKVFNDNGYTVAEFCQLNRHDEIWFFHLLGGHKRNQEVIETFVETFITLFPDYYKRIVSLYPHLYPRGIAKGAICQLMMKTDIPIKSYIDFLNEAENDWSALSWEDLVGVEIQRAEGKKLSCVKDGLNDIIVCVNPYLKCFEVPSNWDEESIQIIRKRLSQKEDVPVQKIAVIPTLSAKLRREFVLFELENQVLEQMKDHPMQVSELLDRLIQMCKSEAMRLLWQTQIRILLSEGLIIPNHYNNFLNLQLWQQKVQEGIPTH